MFILHGESVLCHTAATIRDLYLGAPVVENGNELYRFLIRLGIMIRHRTCEYAADPGEHGDTYFPKVVE